MLPHERKYDHQIPDKVVLNEHHEMRYWQEYFNATERQLREAVTAVGTAPMDVSKLSQIQGK